MSLTYILSLALRLCTPVLLISIGGMFVLKANIFNLALEGFALMGAVAAVAGAHFSGSALTGVLLAAVVTMLLCLLYGVIVLELRVDAVIAAIAFISISSGLTRYLLKPIFGTSGRFIISSELSLPALHFGLLDHLGTLGAILNDQGALVYLALLMPFVVHIVFYKTRFGLTLRSVGLNEEAARSAGLNVRATQYICLALCGIFCGLAGAQLALSLNMFSVGMTDGRGYTALAVLIMADSRPILSMLACFMFGISDAVVLVLSGTGYNAQILDMLPYVLALLVAVLPLLIRTIARKVKRSRVESSIFNSVQTGETR